MDPQVEGGPRGEEGGFTPSSTLNLCPTACSPTPAAADEDGAGPTRCCSSADGAVGAHDRVGGGSHAPGPPGHPKPLLVTVTYVGVELHLCDGKGVGEGTDRPSWWWPGGCWGVQMASCSRQNPPPCRAVWVFWAQRVWELGGNTEKSVNKILSALLCCMGSSFPRCVPAVGGSATRWPRGDSSAREVGMLTFIQSPHGAQRRGGGAASCCCVPVGVGGG